MATGGARAGTLGERMFSRLGRGIVRHPWYPIIFWVILLLATVPFLSQVGSVTTNSASSLPNSAPSSVAQAEMDRLFPNASGGSASILMFTGSNVTGPVGRSTVLALGEAIATDPKLHDVGNVTSLFSAYQAYLEGETQLAAGVIQSSLTGTPPILLGTNQTAQLIWGMPSLYFADWAALAAAHPNTSAGQWVYPAYQQAGNSIGGNSTLHRLLDNFYAGFNASLNGMGALASECFATPLTPRCADSSARSTWAGQLSQWNFTSAGLFLAKAVVGNLSIENFSSASAQRSTASLVIAYLAGLPVTWVDRVWAEYPNGTSSAINVAQWTRGLVENWTPTNSPLPIPAALRASFVDGAGTAMLVYVSFTVGDSYTTSSGANPVFDDLQELDRLVPMILAQTDPGRTLGYVQTGGAALDLAESNDLASSLSLVLPLTIIVLVLITMLYFRAPLAPAVTFSGLGIALGLGIGGVVLIGHFITHVDPTALTLENTFVLGVGTDYSIFLLARYREELHRGASSHEAVVTAVTWAGQSVATSGATAILATLALAFSGVALLSQWGMVLSLAVLLTVLVSLTVVPALLVLLGPRIFWPTTGQRLEVESARFRDRWQDERTYFFRVGRLTQRRPKTIVAIILIASVPLIYLALTVPISYDFYQQLPGGQPATDGLDSLGNHFGPGFAFPSTVLVSFASPLLVGNQANSTEFTDLSQLTGILQNTSGVASVASPVGATGAPLSAWLSYSSSPVGTQSQLKGMLAGSLGNDQRTVALSVTPASSGLSVAAVTLLGHIEDSTRAYQAGHPAVTALEFGGGASVTHDLQQQTALATERMALAVSIGLVIVLLVVLRSWLIPLLAVATIGVSIGWAWGITSVVFTQLLRYPLFFYVPTILFILILGLGIDYNIFLLTRVREERLKGRSSREAVVQAVAATGGIITAAAIILAGAFAILTAGSFILLKAIGFAVATAILLDAMVVRTYLVPGALQMLGDRVWAGFARKTAPEPDVPPTE